MGRPKKSDRDVATATRLIEAAESHFARVGFEAARLQDIAKDVGITRPSLLYHYPTKEALYDAVIRDALGRLQRDLVGQAIVKPEFEETMVGLTGAYADFIGKNPNLSAILLREVISPGERGRNLIVQHVLPIVEFVVKFIESSDKHELTDAIPVRTAILHIVMDVMVRTAMKELGQELWGGDKDYAREMTSLIFFNRR